MLCLCGVVGYIIFAFSTSLIGSCIGTLDLSVPEVEDIINEAIKNANEKLPDIWRIRAIHYRKEDFSGTPLGKIKR